VFDEFQGEVDMKDQQQDDIVEMRPVYGEELKRLRMKLDEDRPIVTVHRDLANALDDLVKLTPEYREATTGGIKIEPEEDGTWRAWLTPDVQVVGSRDYVATEVSLAMKATDRDRGYKSINRRHGVDMADPGADATVAIVLGGRLKTEEEEQLREERHIAGSLYAEARQEADRLRRVVQENARKITNLRNERNQARREVNEIKEIAELHYCDCCDAKFSCPGEVLDHIKACEKHPLSAALVQIEEWKALSADLQRRLDEVRAEANRSKNVAFANVDELQKRDAEMLLLRKELQAAKREEEAAYASLSTWHDRAMNLERERDVRDKTFNSLQHEFDHVSKERDQLEEENKSLYRGRDSFASIASRLDDIESALRTWSAPWPLLFRRNRCSSTR
jgi:uncharacterized coiled-coil DUF342 family protein